MPEPLVAPPVPAPGTVSHAVPVHPWARSRSSYAVPDHSHPTGLPGRVFGGSLPEPARDTLPGARPVPSRPSSERPLSPSAAQRAGVPVFPGVM